MICNQLAWMVTRGGAFYSVIPDYFGGMSHT